ncbi:MAG: sodium:solute symporter [Bacteroidales bacterium]|jgi:SSS family solute:Na+ symporter|nr:sodium:solute symporter [Bacteroidales bacterium]
MSPFIVGSIIVVYFSVLFIISRYTSRNADNAAFFNANKKAPWFVVAFGMVGVSLSGVTFISVPGWVGNSNFYYFQLVLGYIIGYIIIAKILLPLYYSLELTSIYTYLDQRFGRFSYKTGASFFLLSRTIGAAFRLYIVARVLQISFFNHYNIPFELTTIVTIVLIWIYTNKGGIKTIIWTDTLQTFFLLSAVIVTIFIVVKRLDFGDMSVVQTIADSDYSRMFNFDWNSKWHFLKQIISGAFITIVMTGLDQDMMQKNLSCRNLKDAQKNMYWYGSSFLVFNLFFLGLGALLYMYIHQMGITTFPDSEFAFNPDTNAFVNTDDLYPYLATHDFGLFAGVVFLLGIIAAAFSSADSALTALTTSFTIDILGITNKTEKQVRSQRRISHVLFSVLLVFVILVFHFINNNAVIDAIFMAAGYTYGPILGMFAFGLFTKRNIKDRFIPYIAILSPLLCFFISVISIHYWEYSFGYEILLLNGLLTFFGMFCISYNKAV